MQLLNEFKRIFEDRYAVIQKEKDKGVKIIGWMCTYIPEELLYAAGMHTARVLGGTEDTPKADAYLYSNFCPFTRSSLEEALSGRYDMLDGFLTVNSCDHIRRLYDVWKSYLTTPFARILSLPHKLSENALNYYHKELSNLKTEMEEFFDIEITDDSIRNAIDVYNKTRSMLKDLYQLRKSDSPPISGAETMDVVTAGFVLNRDEYNRMLETLLSEIENRDAPPPDDGVRLMLSGSLLDNSEFVRRIEELGGLVVTDDLCVGTRYFWDLVEEDRDPMRALARRYLFHIPCARMQPTEPRTQHLLNMAETFDVEGLILGSMKFCDCYGEEYPLFKEDFAELGISVLQLDREYAMAGVGQMTTRVEAFYEKIEGL
jgi:bzd-type benzoyl-CoA reductase N subunit